MQHKTTYRLIAIATLGLLGCSSLSQAREIMHHEGVVVTQEDVRLYIEKYVPEQARPNTYLQQKKLEDIVFGLFVTNKLAAAAEKRPLSPAEQRELNDAKARVLSKLQIDYLYAKAKKPDFEKMAEETYKSNPDRFSTPESLHAEHILIDMKSRTEEESLKRANEVLTLAKSGGKPFAELALEYSDDPSAKQNKGDLGFFTRNKMVKPFEDAAFAMKAPGEIAGPVKSPFGFHIIRLIERNPGMLRPYDTLKAQLVKDEENRFRKELVDDEIDHLKKLDGVKLDAKAIEELVVKPDFLDAEKKVKVNPAK